MNGVRVWSLWSKGVVNTRSARDTDREESARCGLDSLLLELRLHELLQKQHLLLRELPAGERVVQQHLISKCSDIEY